MSNAVLVRYREEGGARSALLVDEGRKYLHILVLDYPMQMRRVPLSEGKYMRVMDYPLGKATKVFRACISQWHGSMTEVSGRVREAVRK